MKNKDRFKRFCPEEHLAGAKWPLNRFLKTFG
jgi:hypothetical protein